MWTEVEEDLAQKETTRWRRAAWKKPASQSTAAGLVCEASDSIGSARGRRGSVSPLDLLREHDLIYLIGQSSDSWIRSHLRQKADFI